MKSHLATAGLYSAEIKIKCPFADNVLLFIVRDRRHTGGAELIAPQHDYIRKRFRRCSRACSWLLEDNLLSQQLRSCELAET
jgi:hypothetical protein